MNNKKKSVASVILEQLRLGFVYDFFLSAEGEKQIEGIL
jgi:hypothetical protein